MKASSLVFSWRTAICIASIVLFCKSATNIRLKQISKKIFTRFQFPEKSRSSSVIKLVYLKNEAGDDLQINEPKLYTKIKVTGS